jgi:hypothetical protein
MSDAFTGIAGIIIASATFIGDTLLQKQEAISKEIEHNIVPLNDAFLKIHHGYVRTFNLLANDIRSIESKANNHEI